jgi:cytochrome b involved in lipid metabolism
MKINKILKNSLRSLFILIAISNIFLFTIINKSLAMTTPQKSSHPSNTTIVKKILKSGLKKKVNKIKSNIYSLSDVAKHNSSKNCWTIINGNIYNLTSSINKHPGGKQAILSLCGKNGTKAFNNQHGGQSRPTQELKSLLIGTFK